MKILILDLKKANITLELAKNVQRKISCIAILFF